MNFRENNLTIPESQELQDTTRASALQTETLISSEDISIPDIQNTPDTRRIAIQRVGVKGVRYPIRIRTASGVQASIGTWNMYVHLPEHKKGTHMSRFIALLEDLSKADADPVDVAVFSRLIRDMLKFLDAESGRIEVSFPFFVNKSAPVSGVESLMDYEVGLTGEIRHGLVEVSQKVTVPVTSLCPCSGEIQRRAGAAEGFCLAGRFARRSDGSSLPQYLPPRRTIGCKPEQGRSDFRTPAPVHQPAVRPAVRAGALPKSPGRPAGRSMG